MTPAPVAQPLSAEPFWNRRWAVFEDEDHTFCIVTEDEAAEYVVWPEMTEADVRRVVSAHNTVLNVARMPEDAARSVPSDRPASGLTDPDNAALREWLVDAIAASTLTNSGGYVQGFSAEEAADSILAAAPASVIASHDATTPAGLDDHHHPGTLCPICRYWYAALQHGDV